MIARRWINLGWRSTVVSLLGWMGAIVTASTAALAQNITLDGTLGPAGTLTGPNYIIPQGVGQTVDNNLFHSFGIFNLNANEVAIFQSGSNIQNILSRVTGGFPSLIDGLIFTESASVNLFLINPGGILFGPNARLDVGGATRGSFVATTLDGLVWSDGSQFSALNPQGVNSLLTVVGDPSGFVSSLQLLLPITTLGSTLRVYEGQSLLLLGGNVALTDSFLFVDFFEGGRIELGGVSGSGIVGLTTNGNNLRLNFSDGLERADVAITRSTLDVTAENGGSIAVNARNLDIQASILRAGIASGLGSVGSQAGDITLNATASIRVDDSFVSNNVFEDAVGKAGRIDIHTGSIFLTNGGQLFNNILRGGEGNTDAITITASDEVSIGGLNRNGVPSGIFSNVNRGAQGSSGGINIQARTVTLGDGSRMETITLGQGNSGRIQIHATDLLAIAEAGNDAVISSDVFAGAIGDSGGIEIATGVLKILDGGSITSIVRAFGQGNSGEIKITARNAVILDGQDDNASTTTFFPSAIFTRVERNGEGNAGDIKIQAGSLSLTNRAQIGSTTQGFGNAGDITLDIDRQTLLLNSIINSEVTERSGVGNGGDINITTGSLILRDGSALLADTENLGDAGNISIVADGDVVIDGVGPSAGNTNIIVPSQISTTVEANAIGRAGQVEITAKSLSVFDGGFISSTTFGQGDANNITVSADTLTLLDGARLFSGTEGVSNAANLFVSATRSVTIAGSNADGRSGLFASAGSNSRGNGGDIFLRTTDLNLTSGGQISTQSDGEGRAGDITVNARGAFVANDGNITTTAQASGGSIEVSAETIRLNGDSDVSTNVINGEGGDIALTANSILAFDDSDILAFAQQGQGGNITLNTPAFFGENYRPGSPPPFDNNDRVDINASGTLASGTIVLPDTTFLQNSLTELPENLIDTNNLIANSCIRRQRNQEGSFTVTGSGNLPLRPGDAATSPYPTGVVRPVPNATDPNPPPNSAMPQQWQIGDPIVEPEGVYRLSNGELVMSRSC
jgi:filamentous hemagglutinin family protein